MTGQKNSATEKASVQALLKPSSHTWLFPLLFVHRITGWVRLEETTVAHLVPPLFSSTWHRIVSRGFWKISSEGGSTASPDNLFSAQSLHRKTNSSCSGRTSGHQFLLIPPAPLLGTTSCCQDLLSCTAPNQPPMAGFGTKPLHLGDRNCDPPTCISHVFFADH